MIYKNNTIEFKDYETWYEKDLIIDENISNINFNNLIIFKGTLDLSFSKLEKVDLKNIRWIENIINPQNILIKGNHVIYSNYLKGITPKLDWYKDINKPLLYLGGKIDGGLDEKGNSIDSYMDLRYEQERQLLFRNNLRVYNPCHVITYPDKAVLLYPSFPGELDLKIIDEADYLFYDLRQVSEGTRAEFGYSIGKGYNKSKKIFALVSENITNCLTLALLNQNCIVVKDMNEILDLIEYSEKLKEIRKINYSWWKKDRDWMNLSKEYKIDWKTKKEQLYENSNINELISLVEMKYHEKININNFLLSINCELLEYLESKNREEISDIFIFSTLLYKLLLKTQNFNIDFNKINQQFIELKAITQTNMYEYLPQLILWSSQVNEKIKEKVEYNNQRKDHKKGDLNE